MVIHRPPGGEFGEPEQIGTVQPRYSIYPKSVEIGPDGTVALGLISDDKAKLAVRDPLGTWSEPETLGPNKRYLEMPLGVDALGDVVTAIPDLSNPDSFGTDDIDVIMRSAAGTTQRFNTGVEAGSTDAIDLGVSALGEVIVAMSSTVYDSPDGGRLNGLHAAFGNSILQRMDPEEEVADRWGEDVQLAMNARGDAVMVWDDDSVTMTRRRAPLGSFGPEVAVDKVGTRRYPVDLEMDPFGNALGTFRTFTSTTSNEQSYFLAQDGPLVTVELPKVTGPLLSIPPVLEPPVEPTPDPTAPPIRDTRPPRLRVDLDKRARKGGYAIESRCGEDCRLTLALMGGKQTFAPLLDEQVRSGQSRRFILKPEVMKAQLGRAAKRGQFTGVVITGTDAAGNLGSAKYKLKVKP